MNCERASVPAGTVFQLLNLEWFDAERAARVWVEPGVALTVGPGQALTVTLEPRADEAGYRAVYQTPLRTYHHCEPLSREILLHEAGLMMVPRAVRLLPWGGLDALLMDFYQPLEGLQLFGV